MVVSSQSIGQSEDGLGEQFTLEYSRYGMAVYFNDKPILSGYDFIVGNVWIPPASLVACPPDRKRALKTPDN